MFVGDGVPVLVKELVGVEDLVGVPLCVDVGVNVPLWVDVTVTELVRVPLRVLVGDIDDVCEGVAAALLEPLGLAP